MFRRSLRSPKSFLDEVFGPVNFQCFHRILNVVAQQHKITAVLQGFVNGFLLRFEPNSPHWSFYDLVVLLIEILMVCCSFAIGQLFLQHVQLLVQPDLVIGRVLVIVVVVDVDPFFSFDFRSASGLGLGISPVHGEGLDVQVRVRMIVYSGDESTPDLIEFLLDELQRCFAGDEKFMVMRIELIDVVLTVEAAIHDQVDLVDVEEFQFFEQMLDGFNVGNIAGKFTVVYR